MGGSSATADAATTTAAADGAVAPVTPVAGTRCGRAAPRSPICCRARWTRPCRRRRSAAIEIDGGKLVRASEGQLASFSLFKPKDPFSPGVVRAKSIDGDTTVGVKRRGKVAATAPTAPA